MSEQHAVRYFPALGFMTLTVQSFERRYFNGRRFTVEHKAEYFVHPGRPVKDFADYTTAVRYTAGLYRTAGLRHQTVTLDQFSHAKMEERIAASVGQGAH